MSEHTENDRDVPELSATTVLTEDEEREVVYRYVFSIKGGSQADVGEEFGVSQSTVSKVIEEYKRLNDVNGTLELSILDEYSDIEAETEEIRGGYWEDEDGDDEPDIWSDANEADRRIFGVSHADERDPVNEEDPEPRTDGGEERETIEVVGDAVDPNTDEAVITGTRHVVIGGEPLCNQPPVKKNIENGRYHREETEFPVSDHDTCGTCSTAYLRDHGSNDPVFSGLTEFSEGDWVSITTEDGSELTGRVRYTPKGKAPTRYLTFVVSDEPMDRWTYGVSDTVRVRVKEGGPREVLTTDTLDESTAPNVDIEDGASVETIEAVEEPEDSIDVWTTETVERLSAAADEAAHNTITVGSDVYKFGMNTVGDISDEGLDRLKVRLREAGFVIEKVVPAEERDHTPRTWITVRYDPETAPDGGEPVVMADGGEEPDKCPDCGGLLPPTGGHLWCDYEPGDEEADESEVVTEGGEGPEVHECDGCGREVSIKSGYPGFAYDPANRRLCKDCYEDENDGKDPRPRADGGEEPREVLRRASNGDRLRLRVDADRYTVYVVGPIDYEEPDEYGGGGLHVPIELDTDHHEVPSEDLPTESGTVSATTALGGTWRDTTLAIWDPVIEENENGHEYIVGDEWVNLGTVTDVEDVTDERGEADE